MNESMREKVVIVTGGSSGIGLAAARLFSEQGARVVIGSRNPERGMAAVAEIRRFGGSCDWIGTDVSQSKAVENLVSETLRLHGRLDYAFNNGGSGARGTLIAETDEADWNATITGYLTSTWLCMKYEIQAMIRTGGGAIVNNSSVDGLRGLPWDAAYSAAKHGVLGLTKSASMQYSARGIRINAVCPGWIRTPPIQTYLDRYPDRETEMLKHQPIGRLGEPEEVAAAVVFLCSGSASLITGVAFPVDGGYTTV